MEKPKMLNLTSNTAAVTTYAAQKNARFNNSASNIIDIRTRWDTVYQALPTTAQGTVDHAFASAVDEFHRRNPNLKCWADVKALLPDAKDIKMSHGFIDSTMQRLLKQLWVCEIVNNFKPTKVVPIQVYKPNAKKDQYVAWDGQHTLLALWIIATQIFGEDPENVMIPVNIYKSSLKAEMRDSFVGHNGGEYKEGLDQYDKIEQMIWGVRVDGSTNPDWILVEQKQAIVEKYDLFLTKKDIGDAHLPGAISRMQEFMKLTPETLEWLCEYLVAVGCNNRAPEEKELVMMTSFFDRCRAAKVKVTKKFIHDIATVAKRHWKADFSPTSNFWVRAGIAYKVWHSQHVQGVIPHFNKEPLHGYPFLVEQFKKDLPTHKFPESRTNSEFVPDALDLF